ncbi:MAG TPA: hypothetical protein VNJ08_04815 [Bacteriovoracaceae bacterium]|nr:hypothetical protein [Bacteriovoracaceae bacterium]
MSYIISITLIIFVLLIGFGLNNTSQTEEVVDFEEELKSNPTKQKELFNAMAQSFVPPPSLEMLNAKEQELLRHIDQSNSLQVQVGHMLVAQLHGRMSQDLNVSVKEGLKANPVAGFQAIKSIYDLLSSSSFPVQKTLLLKLTSEIEIGSEDEIRDLAFSTLLKDVPQESDGDSRFDKVVLSKLSYEMYLKNTTEPEMALEHTIRILEIQVDDVIKENIVENFNQKFPSHDRELQKLATQNNINTQLYNQRVQQATVFRTIAHEAQKLHGAETSKDEPEEDIDQ